MNLAKEVVLPDLLTDHDWSEGPFNQNEMVSLLGNRVVTSDGRKLRISRVLIDEVDRNVFCEDERKNGQYFCAESLLKHCKFADGSPCGVEIKETVDGN